MNRLANASRIRRLLREYPGAVAVGSKVIVSRGAVLKRDANDMLVCVIFCSTIQKPVGTALLSCAGGCCNTEESAFDDELV